MSVITNNLLLGDEGYFLTKSLRFRSSASAYLSRTPASAGNRKTWTYSVWVKRGLLGPTLQKILECGASSNDYLTILFNGTGSGSLDDRISIYSNVGGSTALYIEGTPLYRDTSAWYHFVFSVDTTQATSSNRFKLYVNGLQVTSLSATTYPTQNADLPVNNTVSHNIGPNPSLSSQYFDGYLTEINFIDGQALTPSSFGETSTSTGVWIPKKYTGTYGTNGFYLPFTDVATTSGSNAGLGKDFSGNGNYWTTNNISVTSGSTYDSMKDVPTLTDTDTANYCVLNPLDKNDGATLGEANLSFVNGVGDANWRGARSTFGVSTGKWYFEATANGVNNSNTFGQIGAVTSSDSLGTDLSTGFSWDSRTSPTYTNGDVLGFAFDMSANTYTFYKNGVSAITGSFSSGLTLFPTGNAYRSCGFYFNFGQRPFAYTPPTGFKALNTYNLPTPTIGATASSQANKYMDATTYSGTTSVNGDTQTISSLNFQPDLVWIKCRSTSTNHRFNDAVRGANKWIASNLTDAEASDSSANASVSSFNSNGWSMGYNGETSMSGRTYVGWAWRANGSGSTNTAGSITSTVSANTTAGFSIATFTTPSGYSTGTVGHGLGVTPSMIIVKNRTAPSGANNWNIFHTSIGNTGALYLNTTGATTTSSSFWNNTSPTSSVFTIGSNLYASTDYVAYCFAEVAGYSKFGSYTGNGSSDGPFIYLGFRPAFIMIKRTDSATNWGLEDNKRSGYNEKNDILYPNSSASEDSGSTYPSDFLSNGFKLRNTSFNASGGTYIYAAFAEAPFKFSNAR